jgi:hypothetical protein
MFSRVLGLEKLWKIKNLNMYSRLSFYVSLFLSANHYFIYVFLSFLWNLVSNFSFEEKLIEEWKLYIGPEIRDKNGSFN